MQYCPWEAPKYFVYSSNIPTLFFYSHLPAIIVALLVGFGVFYQSGKSKVGASILIINILFSIWCIFDLIIWASNRPDMVLFFWSMQILIEPLIYILGFYLAYIFIKKKDLPFNWKLVGILLYIPIPILLATKYNLVGITIDDCNAVEGFIAQYYTYIVELISVISIFLLADREYQKDRDQTHKKEIITFGIGIVMFLLAFSWGNLIGSFTDNWTLAQAGLIGMPIFVAFLAYLVVEFHTFNIKLFGAQVLMASLWFLVLGILFVRTIHNVQIITIFTLLLVTIVGYLLIRSVKKEIERKEQLLKLNLELEKLVQERESLMHLITHKVKGSFTHSKYIFAGILDGTFGEANEEIKKRAQQGLDGDDGGIKTIDLVLNTSNMQKGLIKYEMKNIDFKDIISKTLGEKKVEIEKKGLHFESNIKNGDYQTSGDAFWLKEAVNNLIENSIKYTPSGTITANLEIEEGKILFSIKDTGIGITEEDKKNLFTEGGRGKDSVKVNVDSTGYGLYSVKLIVEAHGGHVWAESAGVGQGSAFFIQLNKI